MEQWNNPELVRLLDEQRRVRLELTETERAWSRLDSRADFRADVEREALRPRLKASYRLDAELVRQIAIAEELQTVVNVLGPQYTQALAHATELVDAIRRSPDVPSREQLTELFLRGRSVEELRRALHGATNEPKWSREHDFLDAVRFHWHVQQSERDRVLRFVRAPGHRPRPSTAPPWAEQVTRLSELKNAKEEIHASR